MNIVIYIKIISVLVFVSASFAYGNENQSNRIEVLVNEEIITKYDIVQRVKINSIINRIEINNDNYNQLIKIVVDDLVIEKLKIKKINEFNININEDEFERQESRFYKSISFTKADLKQFFLINNINYNYLIEIIELEIKWQKLIYGLYLRVTSVTEQEIQDLMNENPDISKEQASELVLQKQLDIKSTKLISDLKDEATIEYK